MRTQVAEATERAQGNEAKGVAEWLSPGASRLHGGAVPSPCVVSPVIGLKLPGIECFWRKPPSHAWIIYKLIIIYYNKHPALVQAGFVMKGG